VATVVLLVTLLLLIIRVIILPSGNSKKLMRENSILFLARWKPFVSAMQTEYLIP